MRRNNGEKGELENENIMKIRRRRKGKGIRGKAGC